MNDNALIASALSSLPLAQQLQELFPNVEHNVVKAKRDFHPDGWRPVHEWISRAPLYNRYLIWLVVAVDLHGDGTATELEEPSFYLTEVDSTDGEAWEVSVGEFDAATWDQLAEGGGDFAAVGFEMKKDLPLDRFDAFWEKTSPSRRPDLSDGMALKAPFRYMI